MGTQRDFQTTAQDRAVDRSHYRFRRVFHHVLHVGEARPRHGTTELGDIGSGDEGAAFTDQHDRLGCRVSTGGLEALEQTLADLGRQGIHRRRIERDDGNIAIHRKVSHRVDGGHLRVLD